MLTEERIKDILKKAKRAKTIKEKATLQVSLLNGDHYMNEIELAFVDYMRGEAPLNATAQYIASMRTLKESKPKLITV